uniref:Uncharacterized protein n=1 Tax=Ditylenchus dipsaci TaxID=166011 RepID=A0A915ED09_9BILA
MSDVAQTTPQLETSNEPSKSLQDDDAVLSQDLLKCVEEVVDDMLDSIVDETEYFRTYFSPKDPPQASLQKNKSRKKFQSSTEKNSRKLRRQFTQDINGNDKDDTPLCADDSVRCRRSTRFVEDLDISQFSIAETEGDTNKSDLLRLMGVPRTLEAPPSPLSKRFELLPLPSVKELAEKWVENSEIGIQQCLFGFLKWIAVDLQDNSFRSITSAEAEVYRQVYIRWSDTFVSALKNVSTTNIAWDDMCIHLLAAELGSPRALSILQTYFATRQAVGGTSAKDDVEPQKSVSSSSIQTPKNSICVLEKVDVSSLTAISQQSAFPASDMKMMADLLNRMLEEKNANSSSGAINATIQRLQRHSINEKTSALEEAMDQSSVKSNSPHPSPNLSLQRMVEIRYQWLIAQLKPEEIGLPSEGNIAFLHRYINMLELVALMKDGERVQSHANFGNGCISLLNVSGLLYEEWRLFNAKQINQLKESEQYEELQYALLHHFDWSEASEEVQIDQLFLLVQCALKTDDLALAVEYLLTILKRLHQKCLPRERPKKRSKEASVTSKRT